MRDTMYLIQGTLVIVAIQLFVTDISSWEQRFVIFVYVAGMVEWVGGWVAGWLGTGLNGKNSI